MSSMPIVSVAALILFVLVIGTTLVCCNAATTDNDTPAAAAKKYFGGSVNNDAYVRWLSQRRYNRSTFLASSQSDDAGVALHWNIVNGEQIQLAVVARATGWVGFGLGDSGSMLGADIILYSAATRTLVDSFVLDEAVLPMPDDCQSWTLLNSADDGGFIMVEAIRLLDSKDSQDRVFLPESLSASRVLAAWGDTVEPSYHGSNTARGVMRFFDDSTADDETTKDGTASSSATANAQDAFVVAMDKESEGTFVIQAKNYSIPILDTTYVHHCFSRDDILAMNVPLDQDMHTIGFEAMVDPATKPYVHHYVLKASNDPWDSTITNCQSAFEFSEVAFAWAPGESPLMLPANVGSPLGLFGFQSFALQIHYTNRDLVENLYDNSGVRLFYTSQKREFDLGVFQTGDPILMLSGDLVSPNGGLSQHTFTCGSTCSSSHVREPLTVISEHLHMHMHGKSMTNEQIRNGEVIREGKVEYWDFDQQGSFEVVQPPFQILPGDAFRTVCNYDTSDTVIFGGPSQSEMCLVFIYYYPRQISSTGFGDTPYMCGLKLDIILPGCGTDHVSTPNFNNTSQLNRSFGTGAVALGNACPLPPERLEPCSTSSDGTSTYLCAQGDASGASATKGSTSLVAVLLMGWIAAFLFSVDL